MVEVAREMAQVRGETALSCSSAPLVPSPDYKTATEDGSAEESHTVEGRPSSSACAHMHPHSPGLLLSSGAGTGLDPGGHAEMPGLHCHGSHQERGALQTAPTRADRRQLPS